MHMFVHVSVIDLTHPRLICMYMYGVLHVHVLSITDCSRRFEWQKTVHETYMYISRSLFVTSHFSSKSNRFMKLGQSNTVQRVYFARENFCVNFADLLLYATILFANTVLPIRCG